MTQVTYHFKKEPEGWIVFDSQFGGGDKLITKDFMKETLYDRFQAVLPEDLHSVVDKCRMKLPAYLQFDGHQVKSDVGVLDTTLELYVRKNQIEAVSVIVQGSQGSVARVATNQFTLALPYMDLLPETTAQ